MIFTNGSTTYPYQCSDRILLVVFDGGIYITGLLQDAVLRVPGEVQPLPPDPVVVHQDPPPQAPLLLLLVVLEREVL